MNKKVANSQTASPTMETLRELLKPHLNLPKARLHCFLMLVLAILPSKEIRVLTMDREFVGGDWLAWLKVMEVPFVVRVKANTLVGGLPAAWWCERERWKKHASQLHEVFGGQFHFAAKRIRNGRDAFLAVISHGFQGEEALVIYRMRWGIESLFSHLKKRRV